MGEGDQIVNGLGIEFWMEGNPGWGVGLCFGWSCYNAPWVRKGDGGSVFLCLNDVNFIL